MSSDLFTLGPRSDSGFKTPVPCGRTHARWVLTVLLPSSQNPEYVCRYSACTPAIVHEMFKKKKKDSLKAIWSV